jgi:hypothetical protein
MSLLLSDLGNRSSGGKTDNTTLAVTTVDGASAENRPYCYLIRRRGSIALALLRLEDLVHDFGAGVITGRSSRR